MQSVVPKSERKTVKNRANTSNLQLDGLHFAKKAIL